ncbi:MAG: hypothetical protein PHU63_02945 [Candidatus ainarchaeum sp.]|nr:hypothetical protein [Candidatus ainarchaeum sp.]
MLKIFSDIFGSKKQVSTKEIEYLTLVLNSAYTKSCSDETVRGSTLEVARRLKDAMLSCNGSLSIEHKKEALSALNKIKVHALSTGDPRDYTLFLQIENLNKDIIF